MQRKIELAKEYLKAPEKKHFDSQGFLVSTYGGDGLNATSSTAIHVSTNPNQLKIFVAELANKLSEPKTPNPKLITLLTNLYTNHPQAIANLERAFTDKFAQIARSYQEALEPQFNDPINQAYQNTINACIPKIREKFLESLKKSISLDENNLDLVELNRQLDAHKESIYNDMRQEFSKQCTNRNIPRADYDTLKNTLHKTPAFKNFEILEITPYSINQISTAEKSSHDFIPYKDADEPIIQYDRDTHQKYKVVRSPIPIPPKKWYKEYQANLSTAEIKQRQIDDTVARLQRISDKNGFVNEQPIYECLLTSFHTGLKIWDGNEQTDRANLLPDIQDKFNKNRQGNNLFFQYLIPTNGFGEEIALNSGNSEIEELAWRNNMALAMQLGTDEQKVEILAKYRDFLANPEKKQDLQATIKQVQTDMKYVNGEPKEKTLLKIIFKHNLHEKKQFARTTATLFCANANNQVIVGCKSGNERTAMILHRLDALYLGPKGGAIEKFTANNRGEQYKNLEDFYKSCLKHPAVAEERLIKFTNELEQQVNATNLYGTANHISSKDTGFDHKIAPNSGYNLSTNNAESSQMANLVTDYNGNLQAHNDETPLKDLAPGFWQRIWEGLMSWLSGSDPNYTSLPSVDSLENHKHLSSTQHIANGLGGSVEAEKIELIEDDDLNDKVEVVPQQEKRNTSEVNLEDPNSESDNSNGPHL